MTTSLTPSLAELTEDETLIPEETLVFLRERFRIMLHQLVLREFLRQSKARGLKKSSLAKKLGRGPELISRWLGRPGNREVDTVSDLLAAMGVVPTSIETVRAVDLVAAQEAEEAPAAKELIDREAATSTIVIDRGDATAETVPQGDQSSEPDEAEPDDEDSDSFSYHFDRGQNGPSEIQVSL